ncbi:MAG: stage II sporulation protein P [Oscillospiraceae bacterium]|nr:stage II sporulation protein P [Oscillospiraceae bacterium]
MKSLFTVIAGLLTTVLSVSSSFGNVAAPEIPLPVAPVNNGALILYLPSPSDKGGVSEFPETTTITETTTVTEATTVNDATTATETTTTFETRPPKETEMSAETDDTPFFTNEVVQELSPEPLLVFSRNISTIIEDLSEFSSKDGTVIKRTFRPELGESYIQLARGGRVRNETKTDETFLLSESVLLPEFVPEKNNEPQVLIIHTHTTEGFRIFDDGSYDREYSFRTLDSRKSVVAVGAKIAEEIAKEGYAVLHDGTVHDYPAYSGSYKRSEETIKSLLSEYPSIKIVLDIHRDAIESEAGVPIAAVNEINGRDAAQIMIVSPADDGEWDVPDYMKNFRLASLLQSHLETQNAGITRALLFQYCNYNLNLSPGSLLIEVGSHGNTLEQAVYAGELLGRSIGQMLNELNTN